MELGNDKELGLMPVKAKVAVDGHRILRGGLGAFKIIPTMSINVTCRGPDGKVKWQESVELDPAEGR